MRFEPGRTGGVILRDRLRVDPSEIGIVPPVQRGDAARRAPQQFIKTARPHSEQRLVREAQPRARDQFEVNNLFDRPEESRRRSRVFTRPARMASAAAAARTGLRSSSASTAWQSGASAEPP